MAIRTKSREREFVAFTAVFVRRLNFRVEGHESRSLCWRNIFFLLFHRTAIWLRCFILMILFCPMLVRMGTKIGQLSGNACGTQKRQCLWSRFGSTVRKFTLRSHGIVCITLNRIMFIRQRMRFNLKAPDWILIAFTSQVEAQQDN